MHGVSVPMSNQFQILKKKKKIRRLLGQTKSLLSKQQVTSTASPFTMQYTDL